MCGQRARLVVYFVRNLLPSFLLTWHLINSYKYERVVRTLCQMIGPMLPRLYSLSQPVSHEYLQRGWGGGGWASLWEVTWSADGIRFESCCQGQWVIGLDKGVLCWAASPVKWAGKWLCGEFKENKTMDKSQLNVWLYFVHLCCTLRQWQPPGCN